MEGLCFMLHSEPMTTTMRGSELDSDSALGDIGARLKQNMKQQLHQLQHVLKRAKRYAWQRSLLMNKLEGALLRLGNPWPQHREVRASSSRSCQKCEVCGPLDEAHAAMFAKGEKQLLRGHVQSLERSAKYSRSYTCTSIHPCYRCIGTAPYDWQPISTCTSRIVTL